jgi:hypothetical protein
VWGIFTVSGERFSSGRTPPGQDDDIDADDEDFLPPLPRPLVSRSNSSTKRSAENSPVVISKDFQTGPIHIDDGESHVFLSTQCKTSDSV